jgi:hypothetical protein
MDALLDRIFDQYGLVVCGWSADWDVALADAIMRCPARRFTTYWVTRSQPSDRAADVVRHRNAAVVTVTDGADRFFADLEEKVQSLRELDASHPLIGKIAVETLKRYLADPRHRIRLHACSRTRRHG